MDDYQIEHKGKKHLRKKWWKIVMPCDVRNLRCRHSFTAEKSGIQSVLTQDIAGDITMRK